MLYLEKEKLPAQLYNAVITIEWSQDSSFIKAYKDPSNGWRIVFENIFNNAGGFTSVEEYIEKGCLMQCNYGRIVNLYGNEAEKTIKTLLKKNQVHFLGSDVHREKGTYLIIPETIKKIKKIVGESKLQELTTINPQKILKNEEWE